jgi:hypothetical protein
MTKKFAFLIVAAMGLAAPSYAQVKVITGDVEHVYGPRGEILDSPELVAKNKRAKRQMRREERVAGPVEQQRLSIQQSGPSRVPDSWWSDDAARRQPRFRAGPDWLHEIKHSLSAGWLWHHEPITSPSRTRDAKFTGARLNFLYGLV